MSYLVDRDERISYAMVRNLSGCHCMGRVVGIIVSTYSHASELCAQTSGNDAQRGKNLPPHGWLSVGVCVSRDIRNNDNCSLNDLDDHAEMAMVIFWCRFRPMFIMTLLSAAWHKVNMSARRQESPTCSARQIFCGAVCRNPRPASTRWRT